MEFIKKYKDYLKVIGISLLVLLFVLVIKGIFPFGDNSLVYTDMHEQVIPFYYFFKDAFGGSSSIFISFNSAMGSNFFGTLFYYIFSPFTFLNLLVPRDSLYLFASVIIGLKIIACNISALYMIKKLFGKLDNKFQVMFSLLYGFSLYAVSYYVITAWIDCMYMLPIMIVGLKNLFDNKQPILYIISLVLLFAMNFYIGGMVIIFIFLISLFYLNAYHKKEMGKKILSLGISMVLAIGSSLVIILPTLKQYVTSSRNIAFLEKLLNSKLGPVSDKIALFMFAPCLFIGLFLLLKDFKKHKKFLLFYIPSMLLLLIPVIVEPVNKMLHFGSYYFFTYRFGFISVLFMIIGAAYYLQNIKLKESSSNLKKSISALVVIGTTAVVSFLASFKYDLFQKTIDSLTLSSSKLVILILLLMFGVVFVASVLILVLEKGFTKYAVFMLLILSVIHITSYSYVYLGMSFTFDKNNSIYHDLQLIYQDREKYGIYRYKDEADYILKNSSMVTGIGNMDSFNSLTNASTQDTLKAFGYTSFQNRTHSMGGTLFSDILLGNKYLLNKGAEKDYYKLVKQYGNLYMYELPFNISFGYLIDDDAPRKSGNTFAWQNAIYNKITGDNDLFVIPRKTLNNIEMDEDYYNVLDSNNYVEFNALVDTESVVYLEILKGLNFADNREVYGNFDVYVNDTLVKKDYLEINDNGILNLGVFNNQKIKIKVVLKESCQLEAFDVGVLNVNKLMNLVNNYNLDYDISFVNNKININVDGKDDKMLFVPMNYSEGYKAVNNGKEISVVKVFDNFIGIPLNNGENNITLKYTAPGLMVGLITSLITIVATIILINTSMYQKLLDIKILQTLAKWTYLGLYVIVLAIIYLLPMLAFVISFVKYISI